MRAAALLLLALLCACALPITDDPRVRLKADLLGKDSATQVLTHWCAALQLAMPPLIHAERVRGQDRAADAQVRRLLKAAPGEPIRYRRVRLMCGSHVLSNADNWYLPSRLTPAMNQALDDSDVPFGTVVRPLDFHRTTIEARTLEGQTILRVRAVLSTPDDTPFSLVVENYTPDLLIAAPR
jgi:hypothetical protein